MGSVIQDVSTAFVRTAASQTTYTGTANLTVTASLTNPALTLLLIFDVPLPQVTSVVWDSGGANQALTLIGNATNTLGNISAQLWGRVGQPTSGNKNVKIDWAGSSEMLVFGETWTGVNQTGGTTSFAHVATASNVTLTANATGTLTVTSASGNAVLAGWANDFNWASVNNTQLFLDNTGANLETCSNRAAGAASVGMTATNGGTGVNYAAVGCDIVAAGAGAALVASWYSPFEEPKKLKARPDGFAELQTNIATTAPLANHHPALFDVVALLKKQTGFVDVETNVQTVAFPPKVFPALFDTGRLLKVQPAFADLEIPPAVVVLRPPPPPFEPLPSRLLPRPPGFVDTQTNLPTIAQPVSPLPGFESPARLLARPPGFTELQVAPAAVIVTVTFAPFDPPARQKPMSAWQQDVPTGIVTQASPSYQFPAFDGPQLRKGAQEWVQNAIAAVATTPVPTFAQFDQPATKRLTPQEWITLSTYAAFAAPTNLAFLPDQTFDPPARLRRLLEWQVPPLPPLAAAPIAVGGDAGGSISGGYFSRKKWHALIGELAKEAHERADQLKRKKERETVAVAIRASVKAAEDADVFGVGAEPMAAIAATLEAATRATKTAEVLAHVRALHRHVAELKRQIDENDDEEAEAVELLWLL